MNIALSQLHTLATGLCDWSIESDAWVPQRLPQSMRRHYAANQTLDNRARCTAGVVLRFRTAATQLGIGIRYGVACRQVGWGSLVVDGIPTFGFGTKDPAGDWSGTVALGAADQTRQIELWFAHCAQMKLLELSADAPVLPVEARRPRWLALGDSITQGAEAQYPVNIGVCRAARQANLDLLNLGIGSACAENALANCLPAGPFDLISIAYGLNDWNKSIPLADYAAAIATIAAESRRRWPHAPIYIISATSMRDETALNQLGLTVRHYRDVLHSLSLSASTRIIDGPTLTPDLNGLFDDCHPTDDGFAAYAQRLLLNLHDNVKITR